MDPAIIFPMIATYKSGSSELGFSTADRLRTLQHDIVEASVAGDRVLATRLTMQYLSAASDPVDSDSPELETVAQSS